MEWINTVLATILLIVSTAITGITGMFSNPFLKEGWVYVPVTTFSLEDTRYDIQSDGIYIETASGKELVSSEPEHFLVTAYRTESSSLLYEGYYAKDRTRVLGAEGADPGTFRYLGNGFGTDLHNVYWMWGRMDVSDPKTFSVVSAIEPGGFEVPQYAKDKNQVYIFDTGLPGGATVSTIADADSSTFTVVSPPGDFPSFSKDKNNVYCYGVAKESLDPNSFSLVEVAYMKDITGVNPCELIK